MQPFDARATIESEAVDTVARMRPSSLYVPGRYLDLDGKRIAAADNGQLQFHKSRHVVRLLAPGNGFGKTASIAVEADWWAQGDHPWQSDEIPQHRRRRLVWACQKYQQWEMMRGQIEPWWTPGFEWRSTDHRYKWGDVAELFIITGETDWQTVQGIEPDAVFIDETCPMALWTELQKRRRGRTRTRFILGATQTEGLTWMYSQIYKPWREWHEKAGIRDEREMMRLQGHRYPDPALADLPGIFVWPRGGHLDNPTATAETWAMYQQQTVGNAAERHVRLYGGFRDFAGTPVFDVDNLERMREQLAAGVRGAFQRRST